MCRRVDTDPPTTRLARPVSMVALGDEASPAAETSPADETTPANETTPTDETTPTGGALMTGRVRSPGGGVAPSAVTGHARRGRRDGRNETDAPEAESQ